MRCSVAFAVCAATLVVAGRAQADEHEARYAIDIATPSPLEPCGGVAAVREATIQKLRRDPFVDAQADADNALRVEVDASWRAHIVETRLVDGVGGDRDVPLAPGQCAKSIDTLAVVLAIIIGPPRKIEDRPREDTPEPPRRAPVPSPARTPSPPAPSRAPSPPRWRASPVAEFVFGTGVLPHLAGGVQGGLVVEPPVTRISFLARGLYWPARNTGTAAQADVTRIGLATAACYAPLPLPFSLAGCVGFEGGRLHSTSNALTRASQNGIYLDAFVEARAGLVVFRNATFAVEPVAAVQLDGLLRRDRFTYRNAEGAVLTLLQPSAIAFQGSIGVAVHFP